MVNAKSGSHATEYKSQKSDVIKRKASIRNYDVEPILNLDCHLSGASERNAGNNVCSVLVNFDLLKAFKSLNNFIL